jgi:hypothetical protein
MGGIGSKRTQRQGNTHDQEAQRCCPALQSRNGQQNGKDERRQDVDDTLALFESGEHEMGIVFECTNHRTGPNGSDISRALKRFVGAVVFLEDTEGECESYICIIKKIYYLAEGRLLIGEILFQL